MIESYFSWTFFSTFNIPRFHLDIWGGSPGVEAKNRVLFCIYECRFWCFQLQWWISFSRMGMYCCLWHLVSLLWWHHFVDGNILQKVTAGFLGTLCVKAVWDCLKLGNGTPLPMIDWLGRIICSSITWPKLKILQYYRTIKRLFDLCSDDRASFSVTLCAFMVCELDNSGSSVALQGMVG